jgi:hypothetical protein
VNTFKTLAGVVVLCVPTASASAQVIASTAASAPRTGTATVVTRAPVIDGKLDDEVWKSGQVYTDFVQRELREGDPVTERTEVRLLTDGEALYVGAWLFDRDPSGIVMGEKIRDVTLS